MCTEKSRQHLRDVAHDVVDVQNLWLEYLFSAESQQALCQFGGAVTCLHNPLCLRVQRVVGVQTLQQNLGIPAHDHQDVVEVVCNSARKAPHRLHFLRL